MMMQSCCCRINIALEGDVNTLITPQDYVVSNDVTSAVIEGKNNAKSILQIFTLVS